MSNTVKIQEEHLDLLRTLQDRKTSLQTEIQQVGLLKLDIETREQNIKDYYKDLLVFEKNVTTTLEQNYGSGTLDLENGTFTKNV